MYVPTPHGEHISSLFEFVSKNSPAKHARHDVLPVAFGLRPVAQVGHEVSRFCSFDAVSSAQSTQSSRVTPSARPCLPGRQGRHEAAPISD